MSKSCESIVNRMNIQMEETIGKIYKEWDHDDGDDDHRVNDDEGGAQEIVEMGLLFYKK